jgi:hypothetical protein
LLGNELSTWSQLTPLRHVGKTCRVHPAWEQARHNPLVARGDAGYPQQRPCRMVRTKQLLPSLSSPTLVRLVKIELLPGDLNRKLSV